MNTLLISENYPFATSWDKRKPHKSKWTKEVKKIFSSSFSGKNISLYVHLPFCEALCTYCCFEPIISKNHLLENKYVAYLLKEWDMYLQLFGEKPTIKQLHIGGGTPTFFSLENIEKILQKIKSTTFITANAELSFEMHINHTNKQHLELFRKYGFNTIIIGLQDFDPHVQEILKRKQKIEEVIELTKSARFIGYETLCVDLLYGLPHQTRSSVIDSLYKIRQIKPERINWTEYIHMPEVNAAQLSFEKLLPFPSEKEILYKLGKDMITESGYTEIGNNHFILKNSKLFNEYKVGNLHYNYIGYNFSNTKLCIGIGARAATDTFTMLSRNCMKTDDYYKCIDNNEFPVERTHYFSKEKLLLRKHFLNLLCKGKTKFNNQNDAKMLHKNILHTLEKMEEEKLLDIKSNEIKIRKKGIQNIAKLYSILLQSFEENKTNTENTTIKLV